MRRRLASFLALATLTTSFVGVSVTDQIDPPDTVEALNFVNILFERAGNTPVFGPNELVEIMAGNINYIGGKTRVFGSSEQLDACTINAAGTGSRDHPGIDDYLQPFADIYVVPSVGQPMSNTKLKDAGGSKNTVFGGLGGTFLYEPLGLTFGSPSGTIGAGVYGIVVDECQDGYFDSLEDSYIDAAFRVDLDQDVPPLSPAAAQFVALKEQAKTAQKVLQGIEWILKFKEAYALAKDAQGALTAAVSPQAFAVFMINNAVASIEVNTPYSEAKARAETAIKTAVAQHRQRIINIAADPPQTDFQRFAIPVVAGANTEQSDDEFEEAFALYFAYHDALSGVNGALLDAIERYQGADQVGDAAWALRHARTIAEIVELHAALQPGFDAARVRVDGALANIDADPDSRSFFSSTMRGAENAIDGLLSSFRPDTETQPDVLNTNTDPVFADQRIDEWKLDQYERTAPNTPARWSNILDDSEAALDDFAVAVGDFDQLSNSLVPPLITELGGADTDPTVDIATPGSVTAGTTINLAVASPVAGESYRWDLDGDGVFDDGTGATTPWSVPGDVIVGAPLFVAVEASSQGRLDAATELVIVSPGGNEPPTITGATLDGADPAILEAAPGAAPTMAITASDPNGDPITYEWLLNGVVQADATAATFTYQTDPAVLGTFLVEVIVSDGQATTRKAFFIWTLTADADGDDFFAFPGPDCLDAPTGAPGEIPFFVNPGRAEQSNGFDDDCNGIIDDVKPSVVSGSIESSIRDGSSEGAVIQATHGWNHPNLSNPNDVFRLSIDWQDGSPVDEIDVSFDPVLPGGGEMTPDFFHVYDDQLRDARVEFCLEWLTDPASTNERNCVGRTLQIFNDRPIVNASDFRTWGASQEMIPEAGGPGGWTTPSDFGQTIISTGNPNFWAPVTSPELVGTAGYGRFALNHEVLVSGDNDEIGVLFGYDPDYDDPSVVGGPEGESYDPAGEFFGMTWGVPDNGHNPFALCGGDETDAFIPSLGPFKFWRHRGLPTYEEMRFYTTFDAGAGATASGCNDGPENGLELLASVDDPALVTDVGWQPRAWEPIPVAYLLTEPYLVEYEYLPRSMTVWVNGVQQLQYLVPDGVADLPPTRMTIVQRSQGGMNVSASVETPNFSFVQGKGGEFSSEPADGVTIAMHDGAADTHEARIDWGDGEATTEGVVTPDLTTGRGWFDIADTHVYHEVGTFTGETCVTDDEGLSMCAPFIAEVSNAAPRVEAGPSIAVGAAVTLDDITFQDPGQFDTHTATIDWGDGTTLDATAAVNEARGGGTVIGTHTYTIDGSVIVEVCVTDQHGGTACDTRTLDVRIVDAAPEAVLADVEDGLEAGEFTLGIGWSDRNVDETHTVTVDWGDGTPAATVPVAASSVGCTNLNGDDFTDLDPDCALEAFAAPTHVYADDDADDSYAVVVTVTDSDGRSDTVNTTIQVANVAPTLELDDPVVDRVTVSLSGTYADVAAADTHRFVVDWGDGTTTDEPVEANELAASHTYEVKGDYDIAACVVDDDDGEACVQALGEPDVPFIVATDPARFADTRPGTETVDGRSAGAGTLEAGRTTRIQITGRGEVPSTGVSAAVINIASVNPAQKGFFTVYPCTAERPNASAFNYLDDNRANEIITKLSATGEICVFNLTPTDLLVDVVGYVPIGSDYTGVEPARLVDTRSGRTTIDGADAGGGILEPGETIEVQVAGRGDVPGDVAFDSVVVNIASVSPVEKGFFTVYPCTAERPNASALNYLDDNRANEIITKLSPTGSICIYTLRSTHVLVDVVGYVPIGSDYTGVEPARLVDTRSGRTTIDGADAGGGILEPGETIEVQVAGRGDIPSTGVDAAVINIASVSPVEKGFFTVYPCTAERPNASALNYLDDNRANEIITKLSPTGSICIYTLRSTHVLVDVVGHITD